MKKYQTADGGGFRMGGDEFVLVVCGIEKASFYDLEKKMKEDKERMLSPADYTVQCRIALGCVYAERCSDLMELTKTADQNMYLDKMSHRQ